MTGFSALPVSDDVPSGDVRWFGVSKILGPRWSQLPILTIGLLGVQMMWSVEMSYASPYLISLGLSKSLTAVAFLAGPISGLLVQPLIGVIADNSKSRFGRRRPYMIGATLICITSMLLLGYTRNFTSIFFRSDTLTIVVAVIALFGLDFSVNAVQAVDRALIVDTLPFLQQPAGNAWAARMLGFGSVLGFFIGNVDLTSTFSIFGESEIQVLAALASLFLLATQLWTATCVKEKILISSSRQPKSLSSEVKEIWDNILTLPYVIRQICLIQFLAWLAWFPFLFYVTVYIGDLYKLSIPFPSDDIAAEEADKMATIVGTRAFFYFGIVSLFGNLVVPFFTTQEKLDEDGETDTFSKKFPFVEKIRVFHIGELWAFGHLLFALCMTATFFTNSVTGATVLVTISGFSWAMTQWAPFSLLGEEILASAKDEPFDDSASIRLLDSRASRMSTASRGAGTADVLWDENEEVEGGIGGDERQRLVANGRGDIRILAGNGDFIKHGRKVSGEAEDVPILQARSSSFEGSRSSSPSLLANTAARNNRPNLDSPLRSNGDVHVRFDHQGDANEEELVLQQPPSSGGLVAKAGIIIGIHNLFIVFPQFISSAITAIIFAIFDPNKSVRPGHNPGIGLPGNGTALSESRDDGSSLGRREVEYDDGHGAGSVAIIFRLGAISTFVAFILCWRLAMELKRRR